MAAKEKVVYRSKLRKNQFHEAGGVEVVQFGKTKFEVNYYNDGGWVCSDSFKTKESAIAGICR